MNPDPIFFKIDIQDANIAWADRLTAPSVEDGLCPTCGYPYSHYAGVGQADIMKGRTWPDIVGGGSGGPPFMLSERVVEALRMSYKPGFKAHAVVVNEIMAKRLKVATPPEYFYLQVTGNVEIDWTASGVRADMMCKGCHRVASGLPRHAIRRTIPNTESWDGSSILAIRNFGGGLYPVLCSKTVVELAREKRWSNFCFIPIDMPDYQVSVARGEGWKGVDYLAKQWPPTEWYPSTPSRGRTMPQWVEYIRSTEALSDRTRDALLDFGDSAVPPLLELLNDEAQSERARFNAAYVLSRFQDEFATYLPPGTDEMIEQSMAIGHPGPPGF